MDGLNLLGAGSTALANQYITFRVKSVDVERLSSKIGGSAGTLVSASMRFVDMAPKAALDAAIPLALGAIRDYGIDADATVTNVPPAKSGRAISEFFPGLLVGLGLGGGSILIWKLLARLLAR